MWFNEVNKNIDKIPDAIDFFNTELEDAKKEVALIGSIEKASSALPGLMEYRFNQLQEIEAILEFLNIALRKERAKKLRHFMESYNRELSVREAEKWIDGEAEVVTLSEIVNEVSFIRNKYLGVIKSLEIKAFQLNNIVRLRCAGLEDAEIGRFR